MKTEKKQCTKCKHFFLFECFKKTTQLTKCCVKCLDICKKSRQQSKCKHGKQVSQFNDCGGGHICEHNKIKLQCKDCDPPGHLAGVVRHRIYTALKNEKEMSSKEYLGCNIKTFKKHIEQQFTEGMSWENYGEWHIDHKIPLKYNKPSLKEVAQRRQYTNTQLMWASENMSKSCRCISGCLEQTLK